MPRIGHSASASIFASQGAFDSAARVNSCRTWAFHAHVKAENASGRDVQSDGQPRATDHLSVELAHQKNVRLSMVNLNNVQGKSRGRTLDYKRDWPSDRDRAMKRK